MPAPRRRRIGHRRRVEDEGDDDGGPDALDLEDDSLSDGSGLTEDDDPADDSDTSNIEEDASPTVANPRKSTGNGAVKPAGRPVSPNKHPSKPITDAEMMLQGLSITDSAEPVQEMHFDDVGSSASPKLSPNAPLIVSSASVSRPSQDSVGDRRRREHEEYKRRRDEDPSFVPNRGAFFMHDHRHAGPAGNGFRPFPRQTRVGHGRGGYGGPYAPYGHMQQQQQHQQHQQHQPQQQQQQHSADPTGGQWIHDMHETVAEPARPRPPRRVHNDEGPPNGTGRIPVCPQNPTPINRTLSTEKHIGNAQVRVFFPPMKEPVIVRGLQVKQYTKLPDHRPPLRRDKPVRISLPDNPPRYIFPAIDRSFIFIPRAMRPNQKPGVRGGKGPRSALGSVGGWSRRTSVIGSYYGSAYSPSIARSRRSSIAPDGRDYMFSPTGSVVSRAAIPPDPSRPIVRLPPAGNMPVPDVDIQMHHPMDRSIGESLISNFPPPQTHPLPQKPTFQENRPNAIPMHQPRPQKAVSVADIESPTLSQNPHQHQQPYQQAFHQQVPVQMVNGGPPDSHTRNPSFQSQHSIGTPLSQIPERAIHAAPFQPNTYPQQPYYNQPYPVMQTQPGYYYPPQPYAGGSMPPQSTGAPTFVSGPQQQQPAGYPPQNPQEAQASQANVQGQGLIAQEVNGMVYYYDPSQLQAVNPYQNYSGPQGYVPGVVGMGSIVTPNPEAYYPYPQAAPGMVYYPQ